MIYWAFLTTKELVIAIFFAIFWKVILIFLKMKDTDYVWSIVDIESFWTEGYAGQIPNSGHELAIYVLWL